ncbi:D-cysteine desulfhydrase family protein [Salinisphaera hydrothermalis]|uniref:D-cysteine desulfhydrase family protein n=1 Tax=Salinisphaera hydrothermalis TaxID=563188 RepID=UPI0033408DA5
MPVHRLPTFGHPHLALLDGHTPIQRLARLEDALGPARRGIELYVKRDDHMSLGGGGNKLRKLEFLLGQARAAGVDTIVTVGGLQSNHARLTAAACARLGLACELVLTRVVPRSDPEYETGGNVLLDQLFGAVVHTRAGDVDALEEAHARAEALEARGRCVVVIPTGGSTATGCLGYARCAYEIAAQEEKLGFTFDAVVVANGSGGTHAGLAAGMIALRRDPRCIRSYAVLAEESTARARTAALIEQTLDAMGAVAGHRDTNDPVVDGRYRGPGYGLPTPAMIDALAQVARLEGLMLDPVYTGKAMAGLLADTTDGVFQPGQRLLFLATGGAPGLHAYRSIFASEAGPAADAE